MNLSSLRKSGRRWRIAVLNGPNTSGQLAQMGDFENRLREWAEQLGVEVEHFQSNHEGRLLEFIHDRVARTDAFMANPGGLTKFGESFRHALKDSKRPAIELHVKNAELGADSVFSPSVTSIFSGMNQSTYLGALVALTLALDDEHFLHPEGKSPINISHGTPRSLYQ